jgi:dTDP-4-dehydro-6-deoxy-alpha-D-glucopyranose 2,3-dehydratase
MKSEVNTYIDRIKNLKTQFGNSENSDPQVEPIIKWITKIRKKCKAKASFVPLTKLTDWKIDLTDGIVCNKNSINYFFSIRGLKVKNAQDREVSDWNQPIFAQKEGGILVILCQNQKGVIKFLLRARYEPGNIGGIQLGPTIQATKSNLKRHHKGHKPLLSEYLAGNKTTVIYMAKHNEEGGRFWRKNNLNILLLVNPKETIKLRPEENFIWLTLPEIKKLILFDNIINPFVKTIVSQL